MLKQILVSILVLVVAAAGYIYFVPGSDAVLKTVGISFPVPTAYAATEEATAGGNAPAPGAAGGARSGGGAGAAPAGGRPGGGGGGFGRPQVSTVITAAVTSSIINDKLQAIGQGKAAQSVSVTTQATGTLDSLAVKPGDVVKAGQTIGQLDADAEQIAYDKANLAAKDAADNLVRTQSLAKSNNATTVQLVASQLLVDTTSLDLRNAKLDLDKRSIVTPIAGTVGLFQVTPGNAVGTQTVVTTVDDTSAILVDYWVPERYAPVIKVGMPITAQAIALPDKNFPGVVSAVDSRIDPTSRTLQVEAKIPNTNGAVTPGMSFEIAMAFPGDKYPAVDPLAVQWGSNGSYVWLLGDDSKVHKDPVQIIQRDSDGVLVKGDLKPGQQVVTQGVLNLNNDGQTVRRIDATASADAPTTGASDAAAAGAAPAAPANGSPAGQRGKGKPAQGATPGDSGGGAAAPAAQPAASAT